MGNPNRGTKLLCPEFSTSGRQWIIEFGDCITKKKEIEIPTQHKHVIKYNAST
jgi:hypothetical protein